MDLDTHSFKFGRELRLTSPAHYRSVFKKPIRLSNKAFTVLARRNENGISRLGLAIAKKQVKLASDRNLIKRIVRDSFRHHCSTIDSLDFVVMVRRDINRLDRQDIHRSIEHIWRKAANLCNNY